MGMFDWIGDLTSRDARDRAARAQRAAIDEFGHIDPNAATTTAADAFGHLDPAGTDAQKQALAELQKEYQAGGMDAQAKATMAEAAARSGADQNAALQRAQAAGTLNSGRAIGAQLQAQQNADLANAQAAAGAEQRKQTALQGAANVGANLTGQGQQTAAGQNQAGQWNAGQQNTMAQQNIGNQLARAGGVAAGQQALAQTNLNRVQQSMNMANGLGEGLVSAASKAFALSEGGVVPGEAKTDGDSKANDTVPAKLSPGEIVIPRSVVTKGKAGIEAFIERLLGEG